MERQSNKHSPRLDEAMKHEVAPLLAGEPQDSRADEARVHEDAPNVVVSRGDPFPGGERLTLEELELRHDLARYIERHIFPAERDDIVASARRLHAPPEVIARLERLPRRFYDGFPDVWDAFHPSEARRWNTQQ
jgi:Protein of unknown function (DUF2795)